MWVWVCESWWDVAAVMLVYWLAAEEYQSEALEFQLAVPQ